eukprot:7425711-Prorocentrum_lima.AAC.1
MTSSLVGSEMCIRDRGRGVRAVSGSNAHWGRRSVANQRVQVAVDRFVAVSYTHLTLPTICSV